MAWISISKQQIKNQTLFYDLDLTLFLTLKLQDSSLTSWVTILRHCNARIESIIPYKSDLPDVLENQEFDFNTLGDSPRLRFVLGNVRQPCIFNTDDFAFKTNGNDNTA